MRKITIDILGLFCFFIGCIVFIGWLNHSYLLIQLNQRFAPMQFNTCLCFIFSGLSLIFLNRQLKYFNFLFSSLLLLIASLTFFEYIFAVNLAIDELFVKAYISTAQQYPGRMAPNTALAFLLFALSSLSLMIRCQWTRINIINAYVIFSLGLIPILGYSLGLTTHFGTGQWIRMAFHTALSFICLAAGLMLFIGKKNFHFFISSLLGFLILNCTFFLWQSINLRQESFLDKIINAKLISVSSLLETSFDERVTSFQRISFRWLSQENGTPKTLWEDDVSHYIQDQAGYVAIEWVDEHYLVQWVVPKKDNKHTIGFNLYQDAHRRNEIVKALKTGKAQLTEQIDLIQGGKGLLLISPLMKEQRLKGFMVGVINPQKLFKALFKKIDTGGAQIQINDQAGILYSTITEDEKNLLPWRRELSIKLFGQSWQIIIQPSLDLYHEIFSPVLQWITLIIGVILSLFASLLVHSFLSIHKLQQRINNAHERLRGIIEGSTDYIAAIDTDYHFITFNTAYKNEVHRLFGINLTPGMDFNFLLNKMSLENQKKTNYLWSKALQGQSFTVVESFIDRKHDGLEYEIHYNPIYDINNQLIGASHIATNIYQRLKKEKELQSYQQKLESINHELESQNRHLQLLRELSNFLQISSSIDESLKTIEKYVTKLFTANSGILYLSSDSDIEIFKPVLYWGNIILDRKEFDSKSCIAVSRNQNYLVEDSSENIICKHVEQSHTIPKSYICFPLFVQKQIFGVMYIELHDNLEDGVKTFISFAQMLADKLSINFFNIKLKQSLYIQSSCDALTGLHNRRFFEDYILKEIATAKRYNRGFSLLLIDIDHFKSINDNYGHLMGDQVLKELAGLLKEIFRESDLIARWGGEEFILILKEASKLATFQKAETFRKNVENHLIKLSGVEIKMTVSIGISMYRLNLDKDSLLKEADDALYEAKDSGRNEIKFFHAYDSE